MRSRTVALEAALLLATVRLGMAIAPIRALRRLLDWYARAFRTRPGPPYRPLTPPVDPGRAAIARLLKGEDLSWIDAGRPSAQWAADCATEGVAGLIHERLASRTARRLGWPAEVVEQLARQARADVGEELVRGREITRVLDALGSAGVRPILLKGAALAYSVYVSPGQRPRLDTDLLIRREDTGPVHAALATLGLQPANQSDGELVFRQFQLGRVDQWGLPHAFDFHWGLSSQAAFADLFDFDRLAATAIALPGLGANARAPGWAESLVLACIHPVMHHRNEERLLWMYDIHLLAGRLDAAGWTAVVAHATRGRVAAVCLDQLRRAQRLLGTTVPAGVLAQLADAALRPEPSAEYLRPGRAWRHELASNLRELPSWRNRVRLLREVALPRPSYMLESYGVTPGWGAVALPFLYVHRGIRGLARVVGGRK